MWTDLKGAIFDDASFVGAYLYGADLRNTNITKEQLNLAYTDEDTLLPKFSE